VIFISQSGLTDPARAAEWDAWYVEHLRIMLSVPRISSAQRFMTASPGYSPSLAIYTVPVPPRVPPAPCTPNASSESS